jgi:hypothetical protein
MAATIEICESNGAGETISHSISNANMGSTDAKELNPTTYPIDAGNRSYIKYQRLHVTNMGGSSAIDGIKVYRSGALGGSTTHVSNLKTSSYDGALSYATPVATSVTYVDEAMPTSEPASANLGIGGSLTGQITSAGYSDYLGHQLVTNGADTVGSTSTLNFVYSETA